ncbi:MAG: (d)CMP kinase [Dehalococcoidia bacterium]|nr:(d)CMP kinase [Dehalococcoidia bacterium]
MSNAVIAVDGPGASGKTTVGRLLAHKLRYKFLDTGAMYRAITWAALEAGVSPKDSRRLVSLAQEQRMEVAFQQDGQGLVLVDGRDVAAHLREESVEQSVSLVSQVPGVRDILVELQRRVAEEGRMVMAGRDIGTVVLPHAPIKVFLTASVAERARRRHAELQASGHGVPYQDVLEYLAKRDKLDSERKVAPLRPALDAHVLATDGLSAEMVVERILEMVRLQSWA